MRFWFGKDPEPPPVENRLEEAEQAVEKAMENLSEDRHRRVRAAGLAARLRQIRAENRFAETIQEAMKRERNA